MLKKKWRVIVILSALLTMSLASVAFGYSKYNIGVVIDGNHMNFTSAKPFIDENNRTMIPLRAVSEYMECTVVWDSDNQTITINDNAVNKQYVFKIGQQSYTNGSEVVTMDTAPVLKKGSSYVPVRYIGQLFGTVEWKDYTVFISTDPAYQPDWRNDPVIQAKLAAGKVVTVDDVMNGELLEGSRPDGVSFLKEREAVGELTVVQLESDPFNCHYVELDFNGIKPFIQTDIMERFYAYFIKDGKVYYQAEDAVGDDGTIVYEPHYEESVVGFDHLGVAVGNPDGKSETLYVFPLSMNQK